MVKIIRAYPQFLLLLLFIITFISLDVHRLCATTDEIVPVKMQLISATTAINAEKKVLVGLDLTIADGWKVYAPRTGDTKPFERQPQLTWTRNHNVKDITMKWPPSTFIDEEGTKIPIYTKHVMIPLTVEIIDPAQPVHLEGKITLITCSTLCLPMEHQISLHIPAGAGQPTEFALPLMNLACDSPISSHQNAIKPKESLLWMMMVAFIGGVILNFMPCVLPIISIKLKFLVMKQTSSFKLNFAATFIGIMISFLLFAAMAIVLRHSGQVFGWSTHFQNPYFLTFMSILMVVFACSIWGCLELTLPQLLQRPLDKLINQKFNQSQVITEGLISGVVATLLATPCTAPFLGTAVGYALSKGPNEILIMFSALGFGFGIPYLIGLLVPIQNIPMPKPGRWMAVMSKVLALGLIMTAVWLLWILNSSKGPIAAWLVCGWASLIIIVLYCLKPGNPWRHTAWLCIVMAFVSTHYYARNDIQASINSIGNNTATDFWQPFDQANIRQGLLNNKIVFIDVTASWCTTCHVNKIMVINRSTIKKVLSSPQVLAMRADWTNRDVSIGQFLAQYKRYGIPFNIVYGPKAPKGIVLPELLSENDIIQALKQAGYNN